MDSYSRKLLACVVGNRGARSLKHLPNKLKGRFDLDFFRTDNYPVYRQLIPEEQHVVGKAFTHEVESHNADTRHYTARFRRKTRCVSRSVEMVELSVYALEKFKETQESFFAPLRNAFT